MGEVKELLTGFSTEELVDELNKREFDFTALCDKDHLEDDQDCEEKHLYDASDEDLAEALGYEKIDAEKLSNFSEFAPLLKPEQWSHIFKSVARMSTVQRGKLTIDHSALLNECSPG